ncbi:hypothetical protein LJ656_20150 [Paraburkholderia sp. MMS20-SJTR3]|uniref:Uncharacterized protein n=1 Tax=Paraburkholderia sejongensis TaxID=2886946 RepID=A0ABS8JYC6_9BURK|nr:hypothetical protein [Paraburkholderia sp. MMS20-SJTR3]MCC8394911.1 hypothetical protein [Paraburkholderia sp. MMS20-SJTR3]
MLKAIRNDEHAKRSTDALNANSEKAKLSEAKRCPAAVAAAAQSGNGQ